MAVTFELPVAIEANLRSRFSNFDQTAKELALVELYRIDQITHHELGVALDLNRFEVDGLLNKYNVTEDLLTIEEYDEALEHLRKVTSK